MNCDSPIIVDFDVTVHLLFKIKEGNYFKFDFEFKKKSDGSALDVSDRVFRLKIATADPIKKTLITINDGDFTRTGTNRISKEFPAGHVLLKKGSYGFDFHSIRNDAVEITYADGQIKASGREA